jgi:hypothetical protein
MGSYLAPLQALQAREILYKYFARLIKEYLVLPKAGKEVDACNDLEISRARSKGAPAAEYNLVSQEFKPGIDLIAWSIHLDMLPCHPFLDYSE